MPEDHRPPGKTTVSNDVLSAIARMAAMSVPGVKAVTTAPTGVDRLFGRRTGGGVRIAIQDGIINGDVHLVVKDGYNLRDVGRDVQRQVARALQEMVGMDVAQIEIHIEDIDYEGAEA